MSKARTRGSALLAVMLSVMLALAFGLMPRQSAYAVADNCSYTVTTQSSTDISVEAYPIFEGDVDPTTDAISNVTWGNSGAYESTVLAFLSRPIATTGATTTYGTWLFTQGLSTTNLTNVSVGSMTSADRAAFESAENALAYIVAEINASSGASSVNFGTLTAAGSFSNNLADYIHTAAAATPTSTKTAVSGTTASFSPLKSGFYLFYNFDETDTYSPIWTPVGGSVSGATAKNLDVLTATKAVLDDDSNTWGKVADAGSGDKVTFRVTGTLPKNPPTSVYYIYELEDTLDPGLTVYTTNSGGQTLPDVKVYADDGTGTVMADITSAFTPSQTGNTLSIQCGDLYDNAGGQASQTAQAVSSAKVIIFEYYATLNVQAVGYEGTTYSTNSAKIRYGTLGDPFETTPDTVNVATYELDIVKVDENGAPLDLAEFTVSKMVNGEEKFVQSDGTLGDTPYTFVSGNGTYPDTSANPWAPGTIAVPVIDAGSYIVKETKPPAGYKTPAVAITNVTITSTKNVPGGAVTALTATADNNATVTATLGSGIVELEIANDPATVLPITGMTPNQLGTVIGVLLVAAGVVVLVVRSRRKAHDRS